MPRILVAGTVDIPAESRAEALAGAQPLIREALAEKGCVAYDWSMDAVDPQRIHVFEEWESQEDLAAHLSAEPYQKMLAHLGGFGILAADNKKYRVDLFEPVYDPSGVPRADFFTQET